MLCGSLCKQHLFLASATERSLKQTPLVAARLAKNRLSIDCDFKWPIYATAAGSVEGRSVLVWLVTGRGQVIVERQAGATTQRDHDCHIGGSLSPDVASCNKCGRVDKCYDFFDSDWFMSIINRTLVIGELAEPLKNVSWIEIPLSHHTATKHRQVGIHWIEEYPQLICDNLLSNPRDASRRSIRAG